MERNGYITGLSFPLFFEIVLEQLIKLRNCVGDHHRAIGDLADGGRRTAEKSPMQDAYGSSSKQTKSRFDNAAARVSPPSREYSNTIRMRSASG